MSTNRETTRLYWRQIRKYKPSFFTMLITIPVAALLMDSFLPYLLAQAVGKLTEGDTDAIMPLLVGAGIIAVIGAGFNLLGFQVAVRHEARVRADLIDDTIGRLLAKDHDFFANQKIGALTSKFIDFINAHLGLQDLLILRTLTFIVTTASGITLIFLQVPLLALVVAGLIIFVLIQIKIMIGIRRPYRYARKKLHADLNGAAADAIGNNITVKTFAHEAYERAQVNDFGERYRQAHVKDFGLLSTEGTLRLFIVAITQIVAVAIMLQLVLQGQIEAGIAIFALAYLQRFAGQLFILGELINGYDRFFLQAAPMTEILLESNAVTDAPRAADLHVSRGEIVFDAVHYAYSDAKQTNVIEDLSLTIPSGQKVGLVGHSGAGKTTVTKLLLRFADIDTGQLLIDGQDIQLVTQASLRQNIAYVPQEPLLFHRSLRENIAYGKLDATDTEIRAAAKKANSLGFIDALAHGLETIVGERGVKLSGGQRQRIAIARAILKDAPILVLDEATSALDSESEKLIQASLNELMKDRTAIVIAHRLSTIQKMDRIIVLEDGRVVEDGSHTELLATKGTYAKLWAHQSGGFIEE